MQKKRYTLRQILRKGRANTRGADARILSAIAKIIPIIKRNKSDKPLTKSETVVIETLRDMLSTRLEVAAYDSALYHFEKKLDAGRVKGEK